jgi:hypothetical protein
MSIRNQDTGGGREKVLIEHVQKYLDRRAGGAYPIFEHVQI